MPSVNQVVSPLVSSALAFANFWSATNEAPQKGRSFNAISNFPRKTFDKTPLWRSLSQVERYIK